MEVGRRLVSDTERVKSILSHLTKLASGLASMYWSLLRFDQRVLALSNQPVCAIPLSIATGSAPIEAVPASGFSNVLEIRIAVTPSVALILTWFDHPEDGRIQEGTLDQASSLNTSVIAQADRHWIRHPEGTAIRLRPQGLRMVADPISPQILEDYDPRAVMQSRRRDEAAVLVEGLIERGVTDQVGWVSVEQAELAR
jgi:hypothetical protein